MICKLRLLAAILAVLLSLAVMGDAQAATTYLSGTVTKSGVPAAGVDVTAAGSNAIVHATTDSGGHFIFPALELGTYLVSASSAGLQAVARVDVGSHGATIDLTLKALTTIGSVKVARAPLVRGSGADVSLNSVDLTRSPSGAGFPETLIQLPGTARGANGVVHMNGDHGVIDYLVDGVPLPQALNREIGSEINPNDISYVDVIEGAYPAQYGLRFGSVLNIATRSGAGAAGFDGNVEFGSYTDALQSLGYHSPLPGGGGYDVAVRNEQGTRGLDPPDFNSPHNNFSDTNQFARLTLPAGARSFADITVIHSFRTYQIPNDVQFGEPANTNDAETQNDVFLSARFRHPIGDAGALSFGPAVKVSRIRDFGDPVNDWTYGEALNVAPPPFGGGGTSADCANAIATGVFGPTTCAFSLADDKTSLDYIWQTDYVQRFGKHELRAGVNYDLTKVDKYYAVSLQPNNFLAPLLTPATPSAPITVVDSNPNVGNTYQSYIQDSWRVSPDYEIDYGLRYDFFTIRSTDFSEGFGAFSPRLKITRFFGPRAAIYGYVGRFFEPFSFENVDPHAAQLINLPLQPALAQFDLLPERDTQIEFGGHVPLGKGDLGFRVWQKNANDLIDDTQVGVTLLHQDINYSLGRLSAETIDYVEPLANGGRAYVNLNHTVSLNKGCETQLLAPCFGSPTDWTPADHEQRYSMTGGLLYNDLAGGWLSGDVEYGSGLSSAICPPGTPGFCKMTPHTILGMEKGFAVGRNRAITLRVENLLNDRYYVTLLNAQGTHYATPREVFLGFRFGR
ncbi:MAG: TonB-dependent receptor [Candidatus Eremiobacteraeota bacterium]|nr:TonB-dependent receptor [Candidatus Eremiobacteraeota bacterium]